MTRYQVSWAEGFFGGRRHKGSFATKEEADVYCAGMVKKYTFLRFAVEVVEKT